MTKILSIFETEYDLAKALIKRDPIAQRTFYDKFSGKFLGICCRYISDVMAAEDIMVESMMKIFEKVNQFGFKGSFEGWAKRLVVNEALMYLRSKKMFEVTMEDMHELQNSYSQNMDFESEELLKLIQALPNGYRTVFNLYAIEGYNHNEIGELLGISEGTSKSQLSRARVILQDQLKKNEKYGYSI
ncbi:sigma-70 family RNA polymerase sigma factor [Lacihabitans sp. LS3-19]|uniref:RNA polymerase sigma factor n=1 Tax=Lacihabitans sp. LS3-19 TaxID=2487335 RepID=UPI0020CD24AE|nr:sigma-70 family RNA polymerase sigma factor [Lacihabitans sp. LS3-19]MCP9769160.1 sigma-70 family RNA polymerase sigma factor [Lacihabitans sp. LS3-19]